MKMTGIVKERVGMSKRKNRDFDFDGGRVDDDVLTEILLLLPVKSVIRFQSVSKSWLSLISSDRLHTLRRHKPPPPSLILESHEWQREDDNTWRKKVSLFYSNPKRIEKLTRMMIPYSFDTNNFETLSSSNGLMLMQSCDDNDYYVYNPTTKQSKKLSLVHNDKFIHIRSIHLVFDPSKSPHYNIVCIRVDKENRLRHQIEVFSSESGSWRVCVEPFTIGGEVLLMNKSKSTSLIYSFTYIYSNFVYCFDIGKNVSELIVWPLPKLTNAACSHSIQESNGCLYYCALFDDSLVQPKLTIASLWKLRVNMDDPRWEMMYDHVVHLEDRLGFDLYTFIAETRTVLIYSSRKIVAYDFCDKSYKDILELEDGISYVNIFKFGETLALL